MGTLQQMPSNCWHLSWGCADLHNALDKAEKAGASAQEYIMWYNYS